MSQPHTRIMLTDCAKADKCTSTTAVLKPFWLWKRGKMEPHIKLLSVIATKATRDRAFAPFFSMFCWKALWKMLEIADNWRLSHGKLSAHGVGSRPGLFTSQRQNTTFVWIALRPCVAFCVFVFRCMKFINCLNDQMNEAPPAPTLPPPCESNTAASGGRQIVPPPPPLWMLPWNPLAVEHCDLWPRLSALSARRSAHRVEHCEPKQKRT